MVQGLVTKAKKHMYLGILHLLLDTLIVMQRNPYHNKSRPQTLSRTFRRRFMQIILSCINTSRCVNPIVYNIKHITIFLLNMSKHTHDHQNEINPKLKKSQTHSHQGSPKLLTFCSLKKTLKTLEIKIVLSDLLVRPLQP